MLDKDELKSIHDLDQNVSTEKEVSFSVDAGIINRLGIELVGKAETAVSELIKNAYDADANNVIVEFENTKEPGGTLYIKDDGSGMTLNDLRKGFMRLSSTEKLHEPFSPKYNRKRAGQKGIGRFATQRLGKFLVIITQTVDSKKALRLEIDWNKYEINQDIQNIRNKIEECPRMPDRISGTKLIIKNLRTSWNETEIKRVFRYVSELIQPSYLSPAGKALKTNQKESNSFWVKFYQNNIEVASPDNMIFDKAVAIIEGFVDEAHDGYFSIESKKFPEANVDIMRIEKSEQQEKYDLLKNVHFKAHYFIFDKIEYYEEGISKSQLQAIQKIAKERGGIRLYRNGFRVLPYGESNNDWLSIEASNKINTTTQYANIPYSNKNFIGFVEIIDTEGELFEETASREGLIENEALEELIDFVSKAIKSCLFRISSGIRSHLDKKSIKQKNNIYNPTKDLEENVKALEEIINTHITLKDLSGSNESVLSSLIMHIVEDTKSTIQEMEMLRILSSLGLTIGEFAHELRQYPSIFNGYLDYIEKADCINNDIKEVVYKLRRSVLNLKSYTAYFDTAISENIRLELKPIEMRDIVRDFAAIVENDNNKIILETEFKGFDLFTIPMHPSEWASILFNLYTNARKAIYRAKVNGKINIKCGKEGKYIYMEFSDNGDGIPKENESKIFNAFFTTSTPKGNSASIDEQMIGTGLGLKIVKDIIENYDGDIFLTTPQEGYKTCFRIEILKATDNQIEQYDV